MHNPMNRRALWVFAIPVLIAIAFGPTVTSMTIAPYESRVLVSAAPLSGASMQARIVDAPAMVDTQWQWTGGWRAQVGRDHDMLAYDAARGTSLVGGAWEYGAATPPSGAGPFREQAAKYSADRVVVVLFGGDSASTETRMYDGQSWTLHRIPGPPPRTLPATMYDAARKTLVLFGADRPARPFNHLADARDVDEQR
jgi:hypothetical protein